jgi:DNA adenine methylase
VSEVASKTSGFKAPFPWFGGKRRVAPLVWDAIGDVGNYVEPFAGSLAVLLARPHWPFVATRTETVNDIDGYVVNAWRAIAADPEAVAAYADNPVFECDLHARHAWLHGQAEHLERIKSVPEYFDARIAGYWVWGLSCWIGDNFCRPKPQNSMPHLGPGKGVNRKLPHLRNPGQGVNRQLPGETDAVPGGCQDRHERLLGYFCQLADRLRGVRVCCGDWTRILGPSPTHRLGTTGVFLDPPYDVDGTEYGGGSAGISTAVREWAIANGDHPDMRIVFCGYVDEGHTFPASWREVSWHAAGGYNNLGDGKNRDRERLWFSPACERSKPTPTLWDDEEDT